MPLTETCVSPCHQLRPALIIDEAIVNVFKLKLSAIQKEAYRSKSATIPIARLRNSQNSNHPKSFALFWQVRGPQLRGTSLYLWDPQHGYSQASSGSSWLLTLWSFCRCELYVFVPEVFKLRINLWDVSKFKVQVMYIYVPVSPCFSAFSRSSWCDYVLLRCLSVSYPPMEFGL